MANVKGIGGVFIQSDDPERLAAWYSDVMSLTLERHEEGKGFFRVFFTRDADSSILRANPVFAIHPSDDELASRGRGFVVNLRVDDLTAFVAHLGTKGVSANPIVEDPYGLFSEVTDLDGNRVELYEERFPESEDG